MTKERRALVAYSLVVYFLGGLTGAIIVAALAVQGRP